MDVKFLAQCLACTESSRQVSCGHSDSLSLAS